MHEILRVWTTRDGLARIAGCALLYTIFLVPFNLLQANFFGIPLRPAAALPVLLGIFFGPAAAWGLGIGNILGDLAGSWSPMSIFGFIINFLYPYLSYLLGHRWMKGHPVHADRVSTGVYMGVAFVITVACMALLALCGTVFFGRPFLEKFLGYSVNNIFWTLTLGTCLFAGLLDRAVQQRWVYGKEWETRLSGTPSPKG